MEKQHLKRLGYGFSALVMALSAVTFVPGGDTYATSACTAEAATITVLVGTVDTVCLSGDVVVEDTINIDDNATIDLSGYTITKGDGPVFTVADGKTLTIIGEGTISGVTSDAELANVPARVKVQGGTYGYEPTADEGYTAYETEEDTTWEVATTVKFKNLVKNVPRKRVLGVGDSRPMGTYTSGVTVNGDAWVPSVTVVDAENDAVDEADFAAVVAEGRVTVYGYAAGSYTVTVTDATGTESTSTFIVYELADDTIDGNVYYVEKSAEDLDLAEVYAASFAEGSNPVGYTVENADDAVATVSDALVVDPADVGTTTVTLKLKDSEESTMAFTVNVYDGEPITANMAVSETTDFDESFANWGTEITSTDGEVATAAIAEGTVTVTAGTKVGTATLTLTDADDAEVTKTITVSTYRVASEYVLGSDPVLDNIEDIIELPEGWSFEVAANDAVTDFVDFASNYFIPVASGEREFTYTLDAGTPADDTDDIDVIVTVYATGEATEIEDQYVKLNDILDMALLYATPAHGDSTITYTGDVTAEGESTVDTSTVGDKTVTITETLAGEVIAKQDVTVHVYGIEVEDITIPAGEDYTYEVTSESTTITNIATSSTKLSVEESAGGLTFNTTEAGNYTVTYTVEYTNVGADEVVQNVTVYDKLAVSDEDLTIDIAEDSEDTTASFTVSGDGVITVAETVEEGAEAKLKVVEEDGSYTFTAKEGVEAGEVEVTITQTIEGEEMATETRTITIVDSTEPVEATIAFIDGDPAMLVAGDEDGVSFGYTFEGVEFDDIEVSVYAMPLMRAIGDDDAIVEPEDVTKSFDIAHVQMEDGEGLINIRAAKGINTDIAYMVVVHALVGEDAVASDSKMMFVMPGESEITGEGSDTITDYLGWLDDIIEMIDNAETEEEAEAAEELFETVFRAFINSFDSEETYDAVRYALDHGESISTEIVKTALSEDAVADEVKEAIAGVFDITEAEFLDNISYYNIDVVVSIDGEAVGTLTELTNAQTIVMEVEGPATGYTRQYVVVRYHNGVAQIIDSSYDAEAGTVTFESDKFSTYALAYKDTLKAVADTGASTSEGASATVSATTAIATIAAIIALAGAVKFAKARK